MPTRLFTQGCAVTVASTYMIPDPQAHMLGQLQAAAETAKLAAHTNGSV